MDHCSTTNNKTMHLVIEQKNTTTTVDFVVFLRFKRNKLNEL